MTHQASHVVRITGVLLRVGLGAKHITALLGCIPGDAHRRPDLGFGFSASPRMVFFSEKEGGVRWYCHSIVVAAFKGSFWE